MVRAYPKRTAVVSSNVTLSDDWATMFQSFCVRAAGINGDAATIESCAVAARTRPLMKPSPVEGDDDQINFPEGFHWTRMSRVALPGFNTAEPSMCSSLVRPLLVSVAET